MEKPKLLGPGYFCEITFTFNIKEDPRIIHNSTVMFFPTEIPPTTGRVIDEAKRKLSEVYDQEINVLYYDLIKARTTLLI